MKPKPIKNLAQSDIARFWKYVTKPIGSECWGWIAKKTRFGYGEFYIRQRGVDKSVSAHRISWTIYKGKIPNGFLVLHRCDNPECVNPDHLFLGTYKDNMQDKIKKGRCNITHGENNPTSKLSNAEVERIKELCASSVPQRKIAQQFGINQSNVSRIAHFERRIHG